MSDEPPISDDYQLEFDVLTPDEVAAMNRMFGLHADMYNKIGRFIVEFSHLEASLRDMLADLIGLPELHRDSVLGSMDFIRVCDALIAAVQVNAKLGPIDRDILIGYIKDATGINDRRVTIVHGHWQAHEGGMSLWRAKRRSIESTEHVATPADMDAIIEKLQLVHARIIFKDIPRRGLELE